MITEWLACGARYRRRALADPETAGGPGGKFLREFLEHCARGTNYVTGQIGSPLDFISFHAKGSPVFTNGHVRMGMANQSSGTWMMPFAVIASFPEYKKTPIIIGESDPEGCAACNDPQDGYRNGTMYSSYTAASFPREYELAAQHGANLEGALTWAFEFEDQPYFAGFRALASNGLDLPVLNVFRMFARMSGQRVVATSSAGLDVQSIFKSGVRDNPDVSALASLDKGKLAVLLWHYHDDDVPGPDAVVTLVLGGLPLNKGMAKLTQYRIDDEHGNAYSAWLRMGSPQQPTPAQYAELERAAQLDELKPLEEIQVNDGKAIVHLTLPRQAVSLLVLNWNSANHAGTSDQ